MTKYLNAEDMLNNYEADCEVYENNGDSLDTESWMMDYLKNHSSADVQPVVHAYWIHDGGGYDGRDDFYHCSKCGRTINMICGDKLENYPYCHCGAKMDGDEHD